MNIDITKTACFTGHRPHKLFGYNSDTIGNQRIISSIRTEIVNHINKGVNTFITGMALGIDIWSALEVLKLKENFYIRLVCAIPCVEQYKKWKPEDIKIYNEILAQADEIFFVSKKSYDNKCMRQRDEWMVNHSNYVISVFNGETNGGTYLTVKYAEKHNKIITNIDPYGLKF